ncbi:glycosyltransferase family 4 protein [Thalassotalea euphylliae]|uniref:glycosyltransferase family 4 protein n=1 Tax=Thalassotalea euphylliae TaxID=1655234 RepID=UPI0015F26BB5|nr:glycosyltransferase family 4 protein [Thalassotalea euphylliae]
MHNQFKELRDSHHEAFATEYFYLDQEEKAGLAKLFRYPLFFVRFLWRYIFAIKTQNIIHVHFYFPTIILAAAYKWFRNPKVKILVTYHGSDIYKYMPPNAIYRLLSKCVDEHIFVSENLKQQFFTPIEGYVLSAGVSSCYYEQQTDVKHKSVDIMFVGRLDENKGSERLISLIKSTPKLRFLVVGQGEYFDELAGHQFNNVTLIANASPEQLKHYYHQSKFLLNLSMNESFGLVITEAMACGVPTIATETDGGKLQIKSGVNGFLLPNNEQWLATNLANFIEEKLTLLNDGIDDKTDFYIDYQTLSSNARASAEPYKLANVVEELVRLYRSII